TITANESVMLSGTTVEERGRINSNARPGAIGNAGRVVVETPVLQLRDGAQIRSINRGNNRDRGNITVRAKVVSAIGTSPDGIFPSALVTATLVGTGPGGNLTIETERLLVSDEAVFSSRTRGAGDAGTITIRATELEVSDGGQVIASSSGDGQAGDIILNVNDIDVTGISEDPRFPSRIAAFSVENSPAGSVTITSNNLAVRDGAEISVSARGNGDNAKAGNLDITAESILLDGGATLSAEVNAGDKGNIDLDSELIVMRDRSNITTNATGDATGGNITIDTDLLVALDNSDITANAENSFGGRVIINALGIFGTEFREQQTPDSDITASSERGASFSGTVEINAPSADPSAVLFELPETFVNPKLLVATGCGTDEGNQFTQFGRGGLPTDPTQPLVGETLWMDLRPLPRHTARRRKNRVHAANAANPGNSRRSRIVEANRWIVNKDGVVELVADSVQSSPFISWFEPYYCLR
ncbi:MAG: S-layer family protein, partial [Moorea sp. SIO3C2]|nr:S-layer family protein [Moorena sp. SIO3C2]